MKNISRMKYKCDFCNKSFDHKSIGYDGDIFCSFKCYKLSRRSGISIKKVVCDFCKKEYGRRYIKRKNRKHNFCSVDCYKKWVDENKNKVICSNCGKEFGREPSYSKFNTNNFCSVDCYNKHYNRDIGTNKSVVRIYGKNIKVKIINEEYNNNYYNIIEYVNNNYDDILNEWNKEKKSKDGWDITKKKNYMKKYIKESKTNERMEVIYHYSNGLMKCNHCGEEHIEFLEIDHIDNNGRSHLKENNLGGNLVWWILKNNFPGLFQILCSNCNIKKYKNIIRLNRTTQRQISTYNRKMEIKKKVFEHYGGKNPKCKCCGKDDIDVLTIHHIKHNGADHRRELGNGAYLYDDIIKKGYPDDYQIMCHGCNASIGRHGYCPHHSQYNLQPVLKPHRQLVVESISYIPIKLFNIII